MSRKKTIKIAKQIAPIISSRDVISRLQDAIEKSNSSLVSLDFQNIEFISRSAAHELLLLKERVSPKRETSFVNVPENVEKMLRTVAASRAVPNVNHKKAEFDNVNIDELVSVK